MQRNAWGIDIGDGTLKAVRIRADGRNFQIAQVVEIPYLDPFLKRKTPPAAFGRRAIAALFQFGKTYSISDMDKVSVSFPSFNSYNGVLEVPRVEEGKRRSMIHFEVSSMMNKPLKDLAINFQHHRFRSNDIEMVLAHAVETEEIQAFLHYLTESNIPYDNVISSGAALVEMARRSLNISNQCVVVSCGFDSSTVILLKGTDYWTRTLPLGLPLAPGKNMEVARERVEDLSGILSTELDSFARKVLANREFKPEKALLSGEGARIPSFVNAFDAEMPIPVEVLRPSSRLAVSPQGSQRIPENEIFTMGKAIGLAASALDDSRTACTLAEAPQRRRALQSLSLLMYLSSIVLVMVLGFALLEELRTRRLQEMEQRLGSLKPTFQAAVMENKIDSLHRMKTDLETLKQTHLQRLRFAGMVRLLSSFESESMRGTFGDYHIIKLEIDFSGEGQVRSTLATRQGSGEMLKQELISLFQNIATAPSLAGPFPAEEETPPAGMAPLAVYTVAGQLK